MSRRKITRREALRRQKSFPAGTFAALLTAVLVTLVGVFLRLEPTTILGRALVSSLVIGSIVSIGVGIIRLADADYKN
jgi:hypothetical protein